MPLGGKADMGYCHWITQVRAGEISAIFLPVMHDYYAGFHLP